MSTLNQARRYITPECSNMGASLTTSAIVEVFVLAIVFIMLIVAAVYAYQKDKTATTASDSSQGAADTSKTTTNLMSADNQKKVKGILVASLVFLGIGLVVEIWNLAISGKVRKCLKGAPANERGGLL